MKKMAEKYASSVSFKSNQLGKGMDKQSLKVLRKMQKMEAKLQAKLSKIDSVEAKQREHYGFDCDDEFCVADSY